MLNELSKQMTQDFGKRFTVANLKNIRQFYLTFPKGYALRSELSWTHYRLLMRVENKNARELYVQESVKSQCPAFHSKKVGAAYGEFFDELHQYYIPGRRCQISDMMIDASGVLLAVLLCSLYFVLRQFSMLLRGRNL